MSSDLPVALVTGAARRIGAVIAATLHDAGHRVIIHCRRSTAEADALAARLNGDRPGSAVVLNADLADADALAHLAGEACKAWGRMDLLVNNASCFYPTQGQDATPAHWQDIMDTTLRAPFFLSHHLLPALQLARGCIVNIVDIHALRPLASHSIYSIAKAGLHMQTRALALEFAPDVRVNGVSPGAILWPEREMNDAEKQNVIAATPLQRLGTPQDIADAVLFLARSPFITGQVLAVDGGRGI